MGYIGILWDYTFYKWGFVSITGISGHDCMGSWLVVGYPPVIKRGWLEIHSKWGVSMGENHLEIMYFPLPCLITGG